jgi:hypothetical protein
MNLAEILYLMIAEVRKARTKFPGWPGNSVMACGIVAEEMGELTQAVNELYWAQGESGLSDVHKEAIHTGAMLIRFLLETPIFNGEPDQTENVREQVNVGATFEGTDIRFSQHSKPKSTVLMINAE